MGTEVMCERDDRPCDWALEEFSTDDTGPWDLYCEKCGRWRDWSLDEAKPRPRLPEPH